MYLRRKLCSLIYVAIVIGVLCVCLFIINKMKYLYDKNQKYSRLESYKQYMEEISEYMHVVEVSANKSAMSVHRLNSALQRQQQQPMMGISTDKSVR